MTRKGLKRGNAKGDKEIEKRGLSRDGNLEVIQKDITSLVKKELKDDKSQ